MSVLSYFLAFFQINSKKNVFFDEICLIHENKSIISLEKSREDRRIYEKNLQVSSELLMSG